MRAWVLNASKSPELRSTGRRRGPQYRRGEQRQGKPGLLAGLSADLWKFYDLIDPNVAIDFLSDLGLAPEVERPLRSFYGQLTRIMSLNGVVGDSFRSFQAVLQGCAWSNPLAQAYGTAWAYHVEAQAKVSALSYADDWYLLCDRFSLREQPEEEADPLPPATSLEKPSNVL